MNPRFNALTHIHNTESVPPLDRTRKESEVFGENVFTVKMMKQYLSREVFVKLKEAMDHGTPLDKHIAGPVANGIKTWAMDRGATHYTHWFQPLTGRTAEKHDSFLDLSDGEPVEKLSAEELSQQEPDASSFPSGGLRTTFEARGYTAWDVSSPVFIFETKYGSTLCIPTIFVSYTGEALDFKIPLLRSISLLDKAAVDVCNYFDRSVRRVFPTLGPEQEYFLVDERFHDLRPDLVLTGRTLFGAAPARGHQLDDHYFGAIPERVFAFMNELEYEAHRLAIPLKTRHNEVAPSQFECAPRFEALNVSVDHSLLIMDLIDRMARKHGFRALLHEKPFAGMNGSGKHNNWSLSTDSGKNLLAPGRNPKENLMFLTFFVCVIKAVHDHADLLRASIASAGNDHRLGANEAPPAIVSVFVGSQLDKVLEDVEDPPRRKKNESVSDLMHLGIASIPELLLDNTDRNRTSTFAFTGNKFEFRAVGSSANSSNPMMVLNVIVADTLKEFKSRVDSKIKRGRKKEAAILDVIREFIIASKAIRFEGDGYSEAWMAEAKKRGLSNINHTPEALDALIAPAAVELFTSHQILTEGELHARYEVQMENYLDTVKIEGEVIREMVYTLVIPGAVRYQKELLENIQLLLSVGMDRTLAAVPSQVATEIGNLLNALQKDVAAMEKEKKAAEKAGKLRDEARHYAQKIVPLFQQIRSHADALEQLVSDEHWQLPKYREMLFIR